LHAIACKIRTDNGTLCSGGGFVGLTGLARHAIRCHGCFPGHALEIFVAEEADEDAVATVVSGDAWHHGDLKAWLLLVRGCGSRVAVSGGSRVAVSGGSRVAVCSRSGRNRGNRLRRLVGRACVAGSLPPGGLLSRGPWDR
jgi:hypothetical protein